MRFRTAIASLALSSDRSGVFSAAAELYHRLPAAGGMNASISDMSAWLIARMEARPDVLSAAALADRQGASGIAGKTARKS